jgi:hypothetical protein
MPTYRDFALLNDSIRGVGDSLLQERMIAERKREHDAQLGLQEKQITQRDAQFQEEQKTRQTQYNAQTAHWEKLEKSAELGATLKSLGEHTDRVSKGIGFLAEQVRSGAIKNEDAAAYVKASIEAAPENIKAEMLKSPDMKAIMDGKIDFSKVDAPKPVGETTTKEVTNGKRLRELYAAKDVAEQAGNAKEVQMIDREIALIEKGEDASVTVTEEDPDNPGIRTTRKMTEGQYRSSQAARTPAPVAGASGDIYKNFQNWKQQKLGKK